MKKYVKITFLVLAVCLGSESRAQLVADFKAISNGDSCGSRAVQFDASISSEGITSYLWEFVNLTTGAGLETGSGKTITKNFLSPGTFQVTLKVSNGSATASKVSIVKVYKLPEVDFEASPREGCEPLRVVFKDKSKPGDGTIVRWEWNYNDGRKDVITNSDSVVTVYPASGVYAPTLIVTNSAGCTKSLNKSGYINVYSKISPSYSVTGNLRCQTPAQVSFTNTSPAGPFNYVWDFGDGTPVLSSNSGSVTHMYTKYGSFVIKLTATNDPKTCSSAVQGSKEKNVYIGKPVAAFNLPATTCSGNSLSLSPLQDVSNVTDAGKWYFEDDGSVVNGLAINHVFKKTGSWRVRFVAYNSYSLCASDTVSKVIQVLPSPIADFVVDNPNGCAIPYNATFSNKSTGASRYEWSFGDGSSSVLKTDISPVTKSYTSFSTFPVTLKAIAVNGCTSQKGIAVKNSELALNFNYTPKEGCVPLSVKVTSSVNQGDFTFDFGNGNVVTSQSPTAISVYTTAGTYGIKVKVKTPQGCLAESIAQKVTVNQYCDTRGDTVGLRGAKVGQVYAVRDRSCAKKYTFTFQDTLSSAKVVSWKFGDQVINTSADSISYTFPKNGQKKFYVTSTLRDKVTNALIEHTVRVLIVDEKANFSVDKANICKDITINFKTLGIDSSNIASYIWDFGDSSARVTIDNMAFYRSTGNYSKGNVSHVYARYGTFYPKLIIKDRFGCLDSLKLPTPIAVRSPLVNMKVSKNKFCAGQFAVTFSNDVDSTKTSPLKEWKWEFGDNSSVTLHKDSILTHQYANTAPFKSFKVRLTVTDSSGCVNSQDTSVYSYVPKANFISPDTLRCGKFDIQFANTSVAAIKDTNQYTWVYGNGASSNGKSGRQTYADTGSYSISLIVKDDGGCTDTLTRKNYVKLVKPHASFTIGGDTSKCIGTFSLPFMSSSTYAKEYVWDFGDNSSVSKTDKSEVSHFYKEPGAYNVKLFITGLDGCQDSTSKLIRIKGSSEEMNIKDNYLCGGEIFTAVVNGKNIKSYYWDFGDLSSTADLTASDSVTHVYRPGKYLPNVILVSPEGCQTTVAVKDTVYVDSISAEPKANIECGNLTTTLKGSSKLNLPKHYVWVDTLGAVYAPDSMSLVTKVNKVGLYILKSKDNQCGMTDTVEVTSSGIVPTADAGKDKKLDCISEKAQLNGNTTTPNTRYSWRGPTGTSFSPSDSIAQPIVDKTGRYILTVTQKKCTKTDTVLVTACTLLPTDTTIEICASKQGIPGVFENYNLSSLNNNVRGGRASTVSWYFDKRFDSVLVNASAYRATDNDTVYAKIMSLDSLEVGRASVHFVVDTLPVAPTVHSIAPICQGFDRQLSVSGSSRSRYDWNIISDSTFHADSSVINRISIKAGAEKIKGTVVETDSKGCTGDTGKFEIQVDLLPSLATVNGGLPADTVVYCITHNGKKMLGDTPSIGFGRWELLKNTGQAKIDSSLARSPIAEFTEVKDTVVAQWVVRNGACPANKALLTVWPEPAFTPTVSLSQVPTVCEGTAVTFRAIKGIANGDLPKFSFYNGKWELLRDEDTLGSFSFVATKDTSIRVKLLSNYRCLYKDTAISQRVSLDVISKPVANLTYSADTLCVENGPVSLSAEKNYLSEVTYEWYYQSELFDKSTIVKAFEYKQPKESGLYMLKVYNTICPPAYDSLKLKIYEKPEIHFSDEVVEIMYAYGNTVPLPLEIKPLLFPKDISTILWNPTDYLGYYSGTPPTFKELQTDNEIVQKPLYKAQDREITTTYWVTVRTGPEGKGCESTSTVQVNNYIPIKIPNAFSPNGDGLNETWVLDGVTKYPQTRVFVFNRWGTTVFQDYNGYKVPWDGTVAGEKLVAGTYYYIVEFSGSTDGSDHSEKGALTIVY